MYKFVSSENRVVFVFAEDGKCYKSLVVGEGSDPANTDYQAYLKWLEEGNTPEPADEPQQGQ